MEKLHIGRYLRHKDTGHTWPTRTMSSVINDGRASRPLFTVFGWPFV